MCTLLSVVLHGKRYVCELAVYCIAVIIKVNSNFPTKFQTDLGMSGGHGY